MNFFWWVFAYKIIHSNWKSTWKDRIHKLDITKCAADQKKNVESPILLFVWMRRYVLYVFVGVFVAYFRSIFLDNWVMSSFKDVIFGLWTPDDSLVVYTRYTIPYQAICSSLEQCRGFFYHATQIETSAPRTILVGDPYHVLNLK